MPLPPQLPPLPAAAKSTIPLAYARSIVDWNVEEPELQPRLMLTTSAVGLPPFQTASIAAITSLIDP
ncbi:MAG TPA: hypothetical protein VGV10_04355 [Thermoleophilaceae bacterium]|nr:hypothetical protein [Thermoleophilaceae bacterium]